MFEGVLGTLCLRDTLNATCPFGQVMLISKARYGRMRPDETCLKSKFNFGCSIDVRSYIESKCAGRQHCQLSTDLKALYPETCPDMDGYTEVEFSCLEGMFS